MVCACAADHFLSLPGARCQGLACPRELYSCGARAIAVPAFPSLFELHCTPVRVSMVIIRLRLLKLATGATCDLLTPTGGAIAAGEHRQVALRTTGDLLTPTGGTTSHL